LERVKGIEPSFPNESKTVAAKAFIPFSEIDNSSGVVASFSLFRVLLRTPLGPEASGALNGSVRFERRTLMRGTKKRGASTLL
jgi:hypothetical protein